MNLIEAMQAENAKNRAFLTELDDAARAMGMKSAEDDPGLNASRMITAALIGQSEKAIASGDVVEMVTVAQAQGIGGRNAEG